MAMKSKIPAKLKIKLMSKHPDDFDACARALELVIARDKASAMERKVERSYFSIRSFTPEECRTLRNRYHEIKVKRQLYSEKFASLRCTLSVRDQEIVRNLWISAVPIKGVSHTVKQG